MQRSYALFLICHSRYEKYDMNTGDIITFGDSSEKLLHPKKNQRYWFERKDVNNSLRIAYLSWYHDQVWWWTRTPGRVGVKAVYIHGDGNIGIQGNNVLKGNVADGKCTAGVRPAMWITI